jgi:hypothetical protein
VESAGLHCGARRQNYHHWFVASLIFLWSG